MKIVVDQLSKTIKGVTVLDRINCEFCSGTIYGLVGQNGSGKTMLMRAISGLIHPSEGTITYDGKILHKDFDFPPKIGVLIEKPEFLNSFSGFENLQLLANINKVISDDKIKEYLRMFALDPDSKLPIKKYSLGMKQKIGIIQAIMEDPDILILDEPFNALDSATVDILREQLLNYRTKEKLIIISSHHKQDIEAICDDVMKLEDGRLIV